MNSSTFKAVTLIGAAVFLVVAFIGLKILENGVLPSGIAMPTQSLENLPKQLGKWTGTDSELNDEVFEAVDADLIVNRDYKNALGNSISLHMPLFKEHKQPFTPHNPRHCYKGAGFEIIKDDVRSLPIDADTTIKVRYLNLERGTEHVQVLFWYQLGRRVVTGDSGMRHARWDERWQKKRAPVIKVLLQTSGPNSIVGEEQLDSIAVPIYEWLCSIQPSEATPAAGDEKEADDTGSQSTDNNADAGGSTEETK